MRNIGSFIALHRFGTGAGPGDEALIGDDPRGWLRAQIAGPLPQPPAGLRSSEQLIADIYGARLVSDDYHRQVRREAVDTDFRPAVLARAARMTATPAPLPERMLMFWSNHFTVSTSRWITAPAIPAYETEAILPHLFGRFADMLKAVVRHPVMLTYLDNPYSVGPNSPAGLRRQRRSGVVTSSLNENLAREVLELHTLGVDGGYGQDDVIALALALTGWSHGGFRRGGEEEVHGRFAFVRHQHEPGAKIVLGQRYPEAGADEGLAILDDLARHPATARHVATKLVRHFVADDPPAADVERIAAVFRDSDGDLAQVTAAVISLDAAWADPLAKVKTHHDFILAVHRAAGHLPPLQRNLFRPLRLLATEPFAAPSPQGWSDFGPDWVSPEALMIRLEWARQFAAGLPRDLVPRRVMDEAIGPVARQVTQTWVFRAPSPDTALAMLFASPEFQRR